ncbi:MAG: hydrolase 2, exosortase A system-associated, partial [Inhella sp.]
ASLRRATGLNTTLTLMRSQPFFLDTPDGRLFAVHHRPDGQAVGQVLSVLPFNEEMNRSRSMVTQMAQGFAALGLGTLVLDLLGTGDSEGDFGDARWALWQRNLQAGLDWLQGQEGGCRWIWGIRLGALMAAELQARQQRADLGLLLWQPVLDGKTHLTQFLRVRMAAALDRADQPKETTAGMRAQLAAGEPVEVAGYLLHPELCAALDAAKLESHRPAAGSRVLWLEQGNGEPPALALPSQTLLSRWPGDGVRCDARLFSGPAFWQLHERTLAADAIAQTVAWLKERGNV